MPRKGEEPQSYSRNQLAKRWGITPGTIDRRIKAGALASFMVGHARRIPRSAVEAFERNGGDTAQPGTPTR